MQRHHESYQPSVFYYQAFLMRPRISIRGSVRPFVCAFALRKNRRKRRFERGLTWWLCIDHLRDASYYPPVLVLFFFITLVQKRWCRWNEQNHWRSSILLEVKYIVHSPFLTMIIPVISSTTAEKSH